MHAVQECTWCKDWTLTGPEGSPTLGDGPRSYGRMTVLATWASSPFQGIPECLTDLWWVIASLLADPDAELNVPVA